MRVLILLLLLTACAGGPSDRCPLELAGILPVRLLGNVPVTVVGINGQPALFLLDTGSDVTLVRREAALRLGVPFNRKLGLRLRGAGGQAVANIAVLPVLQLGDAVVTDVRAVVGGEALPPAFDGLLGINVLAGFELDLDAPAGRLTVYRARACAGAPPPWTGPFTRLDTQQQPSGHLIAPATLNGRPVHAVLDTGASTTTVGPATAAEAGITPENLLRGPSSLTRTVSAGGIMVRPRRFRELRIGNDVIAEPVLNIAELPPETEDMIIGSDYLATRRVWIALGTGSVFVGPPPAAAPANEPADGVLPSSAAPEGILPYDTAGQPRPR